MLKAFRELIVSLCSHLSAGLLLLSTIIVIASLFSRYVLSASWVEGTEFLEVITPWIVLLGLPALLGLRTEALQDSWLTRVGIGVQFSLFLALAAQGAAILGRNSPQESAAMTSIGIAVLTGCGLTALVVVLRLSDMVRSNPPSDPAVVDLFAVVRLFALPALALAAWAYLASVVGTDAPASMILGQLSESPTATITAFALAGELVRVVNGELVIRRLVQTILAGTRFTPVVAPLVAAAMQGPVFMRSGRSLAGENAREASEMLHVMKSQGLSTAAAWNVLAAGGACALLLSPSFPAVIVSGTLNISIGVTWFAGIFPSLVLLTALLLVAAGTRTKMETPKVPKLADSRIFQIWRDFVGMTALILAPVTVLSLVGTGMGTPGEVAGWVATTGFIIAFTQPIRPRFRDIVAALRRGAIVAADIVFTVVAANIVVLALRRTGLEPVAHASILTSIAFGLLAPTAISFLLGIPASLVLSGVFFLWVGPIAGSSNDPIVKILLVSYGAVLGAFLQVCFFPPLALERSRVSAIVLWTLPFLLCWLFIFLLPKAALWGAQVLY